MKKFILCIGVIFIIVAILIIKKYIQDTRYDLVLKGVSYKEAKNLCDMYSDKYIIIEIIEGTGIDFIISYGNNVGEKIYMMSYTGVNTPNAQLNSSVFFIHKNRFLIEIEEIRVATKDESKYTLGDDITKTVVVKTWLPITPIHRSYEYSDGDKSRTFYPKKYIDEFDLISGAYNLD